MEIERKFLVNAEKWNEVQKPEPQLFRQGYFTTSPGKSIRIRNSSHQSFLTIKSALSGVVRHEFEYEIPNEDAVQLLDNFCDARLEKYRYVIPFKNKIWEVDCFLKENSGLIIAEIELEGPEENVELPDWIDKEVTAELKYYNENLVQLPFKKW